MRFWPVAKSFLCVGSSFGRMEDGSTEYRATHEEPSTRNQERLFPLNSQLASQIRRSRLCANSFLRKR